MEQKRDNFENEINDLKQELEHFQQEKDRVRTIVGKIGGMPKFHEKIINTIFIIIVIGSVGVSVFSPKLRLLMVEIATVTLSLKIIYLIHCQMKINHFKFWILSSIEWRIIEMNKHLRELKK